jgi:hypothetical protein
MLVQRSPHAATICYDSTSTFRPSAHHSPAACCMFQVVVQALRLPYTGTRWVYLMVCCSAADGSFVPRSVSKPLRLVTGCCTFRSVLSKQSHTWPPRQQPRKDDRLRATQTRILRALRSAGCMLTKVMLTWVPIPAAQCTKYILESDFLSYDLIKIGQTQRQDGVLSHSLCTAAELATPSEGGASSAATKGPASARSSTAATTKDLIIATCREAVPRMAKPGKDCRARFRGSKILWAAHELWLLLRWALQQTC